MRIVRQAPRRAAWARDRLVPSIETQLRRVLTRWNGTSDPSPRRNAEVNFETADAAVNAALDLHTQLRQHDWQSAVPGLRSASTSGRSSASAVDESASCRPASAIDRVRQLTAIAAAGQTLLTRAAFDIAREHVRQLPPRASDGDSRAPTGRRTGDT